jgi:transcription initiation factor TFIID subunit TAF12
MFAQNNNNNSNNKNNATATTTTQLQRQQQQQQQKQQQQQQQQQRNCVLHETPRNKSSFMSECIHVSKMLPLQIVHTCFHEINATELFENAGTY